RRAEARALFERGRLHDWHLRRRRCRQEPARVEGAGRGNGRRTLPAALARRADADLRADRARDPQRIHHRLRAARSRRRVPSRPGGRRSGAVAAPERPDAAGIFRRAQQLTAMTRDDTLRWIERGLLAAGIGLGAWCAAVLVEARFHHAVSMRDAGQLVVTQTAVPALPGDAGDTPTRTRPAPAAGPPPGRLGPP